MNVMEIPKKVLRRIYRIMLNCRSEYYMNKVISQKKKHSGKIKVGFLVQMPEVWDKEEPVYRAMVESTDFEPYLVIVPKYDFVNKKIGFCYGDEKQYFEKFSHGENVIYAFKNEEAIDLSQYNFDYVFFQRPYDNYLHPKLQSRDLVKYTKICYIPYAMWDCMNEFACGFNITFFRNIYLGFMESEEHAALIQSRLSLRNHIIFRGYPVLENVKYEIKHGNIFSILWAPRWTYDTTFGESHFFEYRESFVGLKDELKDVSLTLRPHPLMFDNFVREGRITEGEVKNFKDLLKQKGIILDTDSLISDTFEESDVLLMDISSIVMPFFLTGKPIILCNCDYLRHRGISGGVRLCFWFSQVIDCLYIADSWEDVRKYLAELMNGNDYLYEKRQKVASALLCENAGATKRILNTLRQDFAGMTHACNKMKG